MELYKPSVSFQEEAISHTKPEYCKKCMTSDMINVISKRCILCNDKIPSFNYVGEKKAKYCSLCKLEEMVT